MVGSLLPEIFTDTFGRKFCLHSRASDVTKAVDFSDSQSAEIFLRNLNISDKRCRMLILSIDGGLTDDQTLHPRSCISRWLVSGKLCLSSLVGESAIGAQSGKRQLTDASGSAYMFVQDAHHAGVSSRRIKTFHSAKEAEAFLRSLSPSKDNLDAIAQLVDVESGVKRPVPAAQSVSTNPSEQLIKKLGESIANKKIAVVQTSMTPPASADKTDERDLEDRASGAPGARSAGLGPEPDPKAYINIALKQWDADSQSDTAMVISEWKMTSPVSKSGSASNISVEVPVGTAASAVNVTTQTRVKTLVSAPISDAAQDTDYPIKIQHADWKDTTDRATQHNSNKIDWKLTVSELASLDNGNGLKARLRNLGFATDDNDATQRSVRAYQYMYLNEAAGSGKLNDIKSDLMRRHDSA